MCFRGLNRIFRKSQYKAFLKTLWFLNYNQFHNFVWHFIGLYWPIHWDREGLLFLDLAFIIWYFAFQYSFLSFAFKSLSRNKKPPYHSLDITFVSFNFFFNVFELIVFIWLFRDKCILYVFVIYNNAFIVMVIERIFYAMMRGNQFSNCYINKKVSIFFKNGKLFFIIFHRYPSLQTSPEFMTLGFLKYA